MSNSINFHKKYLGKIEIKLKAPLENKQDLALAYTPGVAQVSKEIAENKEKVNLYTNRANSVAVITDGSAVLGLGNIGPEAAYPVMEGKAVLFKKFANIDAFPICLNTQKTQEIISIIKSLEPTFAGINLEDISAPRCFEIEKKLIEEMNIPIFHDDQHGTAIVVLAGLINATKLVKKDIKKLKVIINGAGAAGIAIAKLLYNYGITNIIALDSKGDLCSARQDMNWAKKELTEITHRLDCEGRLEDVLPQADVFIGVSGPNILKPEWIKLMNPEPIIFAMANPIPEIDPQLALQSGAKIVATGRSDYPNQINNVLAFPGIFRGVFDAKIKKITAKMKISAAESLANVIPESELRTDYIIPDAFNEKIVPAVSDAVKI